ENWPRYYWTYTIESGMRVGVQVPGEKVIEKRVPSVGDGFSIKGDWSRLSLGRERVGYSCRVVGLANYIAQRGL
ncbi:MAG: hypothetical protein ACE5II_04365, partial [Anaerolineae bacterium]